MRQYQRPHLVVLLLLVGLIISCDVKAKPTSSTEVGPQKSGLSSPQSSEYNQSSIPPEETYTWASESTTAPAGKVFWSPIANEFLYSNCSSLSAQQDGAIYKATFQSASSPETVALGFVCPNLGTTISWVPDGASFLFTGVSLDSVSTDYFPENAAIFQPDAFGRPTAVLPINKVNTNWTPGFVEWVTDDVVLYSGYGGGGHINSALLDIVAQTRSELIVSHACGFGEIGMDYMGGCTGWGATFHVEAIAISLSYLERSALPINDPLLAPEEFFLRSPERLTLTPQDRGGTPDASLDLNSRYMDWRPDSNEMLVLIWEAGRDLVADTPITSQLALWNLDNNTLSLTFSNAIAGTYSSNGDLLAVISMEESGPFVHLLKTESGEVLYSAPMWFPQGWLDYAGATIQFSPDERYFAFFGPLANAEDHGGLSILDIASLQIVANASAALVRPNWSPDGARIVFLQNSGALALLDIEANLTHALGLPGNFSPWDVGWSYDGSSLSFPISEETSVILALK